MKQSAKTTRYKMTFGDKTHKHCPRRTIQIRRDVLLDHIRLEEDYYSHHVSLKSNHNEAADSTAGADGSVRCEHTKNTPG